MEENCCHTHFKKHSENRDREGKKHYPGLKHFNLLKSRQLSDLISLEVSGEEGRVNPEKFTDVAVKGRTRDSHGRESGQVLMTAKPGIRIQHLGIHSGSTGYIQLLYLQDLMAF